MYAGGSIYFIIINLKMTFITVDILGGSVGVILSLLMGIIITYVSIIKASSNKRRKLVIKTLLLIWAGVIIFLALPLIFSLLNLIPEWGYWVGIFFFLIVVIPFVSSYYKKRAYNLPHLKA